MNIKRMEISFWRRKSRQEGKVQIYCRISVGGERVDLGSTGITTGYDHWDPTQKQLTSHDPEAFFKNEQLGIIRDQLYSIYNDFFRRKEKITAGKIRRAYFNHSTNIGLLVAFDLYLKDRQTDAERPIKAVTLINYDIVRKKLTTFLLDQQAADLLVEDFDLDWVKKYRRWLKQVPINRRKVGHADCYINRSLQTIMNVMRWSKLNKLADSNPLVGLRLKAANFGDPIFLSGEQFESLRTHSFTDPELQQVADLFIILCRCGFHYGDLMDFVLTYKTSLRTGVDGQPWMIKDRIKTEVSIRVPVFDEVQQVVDKYGGWEHLPCMRIHYFNDNLKLIAAKLNLPDRLSSKAGRKTFTDWCFNTLLLSTDSILVLLGRKSEKGLEVYGRPDERRVAAELEQSQEMKNRKKDNGV